MTEPVNLGLTHLFDQLDAVLRDYSSFLGNYRKNLLAAGLSEELTDDLIRLLDTRLAVADANS